MTKDSPGDSTFETLSTILTIENLNSVNHSYPTINCDTGQHSQFLRCFMFLWLRFFYFFYIFIKIFGIFSGRFDTSSIIALSVSEILALGGFCDEEQQQEWGILVVGCSSQIIPPFRSQLLREMRLSS